MNQQENRLLNDTVWRLMCQAGVVLLMGGCASLMPKPPEVSQTSMPSAAVVQAAPSTIPPNVPAPPGAPEMTELDKVRHFVQSARYGEKSTVEFYLSRQMPVNAADGLGDTALAGAASGGHLEIVNLLLEAGANVNAHNKMERTVLMAAAIRGDDGIIKTLLARGAAVNVVDNMGETALFDAARYGSAATVKLLLDAGADPNVKNKVPPSFAESGFTPLMYVARHNLTSTAEDWIDIVRALLSKGADPNIRNSHGGTALSIAREYGHSDIVALMEEHGAKQVSSYSGLTVNDTLITASMRGDARGVKESLDAGADPNAETREGITPLLAAAYGGEVEAVRLLVQRGADVNTIPNGYRAWTWIGAKMPLEKQPLAQAASVGDTAIILASRRGHASIVAFLLDHGADPRRENPRGETAMGVAAEQGHAEVVQLLLARGVDPNEGRQAIAAFGEEQIGREELNTPLIKASMSGHMKAARALLDARVDPDIRGFAGNTALFWAVERGNVEMVQLLLDGKANPNIRNNAGQTPLLQAAKSGNFVMVSALVAHNADVNAREGREVLPGIDDTSGGGMTALMYAVSGGHVEIVKVLLGAGADVSMRNKQDQSALDEAKRLGHNEIVQLLRKPGAIQTGKTK